MASALDMTLDDIIKSNKKASVAGAGAGAGRNSRKKPIGVGGPTRRISKRLAKRPAPYSVAKAPDAAWKHDMYTDYTAPTARVSAIETGTKLYISNLDYGVSNEDIKELFTEVGDLKRCSIHYDRSGRSKGSAEVVFARRADALAAVKRYNNVQLDGKPMKIEIVGTNVSKPAAAATPSAANGGFGNPRNAPKSGPKRGGGAFARKAGRGRERRRNGQGKSRQEKKAPPSAADLDADLDKYHAEAMQTN